MSRVTETLWTVFILLVLILVVQAVKYPETKGPQGCQSRMWSDQIEIICDESP